MRVLPCTLFLSSPVYGGGAERSEAEGGAVPHPSGTAPPSVTHAKCVRATSPVNGGG